jgi:hypothetical protein
MQLSMHIDLPIEQEGLGELNSIHGCLNICLIGMFLCFCLLKIYNYIWFAHAADKGRKYKYRNFLLNTLQTVRIVKNVSSLSKKMLQIVWYIIH